jgi:hypothetical protein
MENFIVRLPKKRKALGTQEMAKEVNNPSTQTNPKAVKIISAASGSGDLISSNHFKQSYLEFGSFVSGIDLISPSAQFFLEEVREAGELCGL